MSAVAGKGLSRAQSPPLLTQGPELGPAGRGSAKALYLSQLLAEEVVAAGARRGEPRLPLQTCSGLQPSWGTLGSRCIAAQGWDLDADASVSLLAGMGRAQS